MHAPRLAAFALVLLGGAGVAAAKPAAATAKDHYAAGTRLFNLAKYDEAIVEFEAAYQLKDEPAFLYNIAQSHRLAGRSPQAIRFYKNFLRAAPTTPLRPDVEQKLADLERPAPAASSPTTPPPFVTPPPRDTPTNGRRIAGWTLIPSGAVVNILGAALFLSAFDEFYKSSRGFEVEVKDWSRFAGGLAVALAGNALAVLGIILLSRPAPR